jgi:hypothetical protein
VGGIGELVDTPSANRAPLAWTVPPCDSRQLADAVIGALDDPDERSRRAARARARARFRFDVSHMVESTLAVYNELLEGPHEVPAHQPVWLNYAVRTRRDISICAGTPLTACLHSSGKS